MALIAFTATGKTPRVGLEFPRFGGPGRSSFISADSGDVINPVIAFAHSAFPPPQVSMWEKRKHNWVVVPDEAEHIY